MFGCEDVPLTWPDVAAGAVVLFPMALVIIVTMWFVWKD